MTSKDDIKGLVCLKFLRPCHVPYSMQYWGFGGPVPHSNSVRYGAGAQRNELTRGPAEFVQHFSFVYSGCSHRRTSAALHKFDMVRLYRSPIPVGMWGMFYSFNWFLPALAFEEGGGSAPCGQEGLGEPVPVHHISTVRYLLPFRMIFAKKNFVSTLVLN